MDIKDNRVVKGVNFVNLRDAGDPVELARAYNKKGADEVVFLDITATNNKRRSAVNLARRVAKKLFIPFTIGGGIKTIDDIREILKAGADKVSINSAAVKTPEIITKGAEVFGSQCIVVAIDVKKSSSSIDSRNCSSDSKYSSGYNVYINAGTKDTGKDALSWTKEVEKLGAGEILLTSMDADGTKNGFDLDITRKVSESVSIPVIASGGAGQKMHFRDVFQKAKADAALAASVFHYEEIEIEVLKKYLSLNNIPVRL